MQFLKIHRATRHIILAGLSGIMTFCIYLLLDSPSGMFRLSMATAYTSLLLLSITLILGPLNIIQDKPNPVSSYLRRDIGIWAAIIAIAHVIFGLQRHFGGRIWRYFLHDRLPGGEISIRFDATGFANHSGLIATFICILLLCLSNNRSLKKLGMERWKNIQRLNYISFILVVGHAILYQVLGKRELGFIIIIIVAFITIVVLQIRGFFEYNTHVK